MTSLFSRCFICILLALFLMCSSALSADLTFFVGGIRPGTVSSQGSRISLDGSPVFGARLSTNFVPLFGMEHTLAFSSDYLFPRGIASVTKAKGIVYNSNLIVTIPVGNLQPYVTAGLGLIRQYGSPNLPVGTKFAVNYGGGLKLPHLAGPLGLRVDMRGYHATGVFSGGLNLFEVTGGLLLSF